MVLHFTCQSARRRSEAQGNNSEAVGASRNVMLGWGAKARQGSFNLDASGSSVHKFRVSTDNLFTSVRPRAELP